MIASQHTLVAAHRALVRGPNGSAVERTWLVDTSVASASATWALHAPQLLEADLTGMSCHFPGWWLMGSLRGRPTLCPSCVAPCAPTMGAIRCVRCGADQRADGLVWFGHLLVPAQRDLDLRRYRRALQAAGFAEIGLGQSPYLLVPLTVAYPHSWPSMPPLVRYSTAWLDALQLPHNSVACRLSGTGTAQLFAPGEWQPLPIHAVLQQHVHGHLNSLLAIAAGTEAPAQQWQPGRAAPVGVATAAGPAGG